MVSLWRLSTIAAATRPYTGVSSPEQHARGSRRDQRHPDDTPVQFRWRVPRITSA
jgi:hypothetical protein